MTDKPLIPPLPGETTRPLVSGLPKRPATVPLEVFTTRAKPAPTTAQRIQVLTPDSRLYCVGRVTSLAVAPGAKWVIESRVPTEYTQGGPTKGMVKLVLTRATGNRKQRRSK